MSYTGPTEPVSGDGDNALLLKIAALLFAAFGGNAAPTAGELQALAVNNVSGTNGSITVEDTDAHEGNFYCIMPVTDIEISALTGNNEGTVGVTRPAGVPLYGKFTSVTLATGTADLYNA